MPHPKFCEEIKQGCRKGTFLARNGHVQYVIQWDGDPVPRWVPAVGIEKTGRINNALLTKLSEEVAKNVSSKTHLRRRGGLTKGKVSVVGKTGTQGRAGTVDDPRLAHEPVKDEAGA